MSLFHNAVVTKYLQVLNQDSINQKWNEFAICFHNSERQITLETLKKSNVKKAFWENYLDNTAQKLTK